MATRAQIRTRNWHRQVATQLGFGRSTLKHRSLAGNLAAPSPTGVVVYTPPGAIAGDEATTDTLIWAIWQQKLPRTTAQDDIVPGKTIYENYVGQFAVVDDNGNVVVFADEDWLVDNQNPPNRYKVQNPVIDSSLSFVTFEMERLR
jgi:hypothetical protein